MLGCAVDSLEFPRRHAEVVNLFGRVTGYLQSLAGDDEDRQLYLKYAPAWYSAIVFRDSWASTQKPASSIIDQQTLDHLRGLGRILHRSSGEDLTEDAVITLRLGLTHWRDLLEESGIPQSVMDRIKAQVDLIEWLLDNVGIYGAEPVVRESRNLVGIGVEVLQQVPAKAKKAAVGLAFVAYFLGLVHHGVDETAGILEGLNSVQVQYEQLVTGPRAIEGSEQTPQIEPKPAKIIDAEVVDDDASSQ